MNGLHPCTLPQQAPFAAVRRVSPLCAAFRAGCECARGCAIQPHVAPTCGQVPEQRRESPPQRGEILPVGRSQHCLDLIKGIAVVPSARLRLKQYNGPNILPANCFCGNSFLLNASSQPDGILNDTLPGGAVIYHYGELYHVFLLQFTGVHIGDNVAVFPWRCR